MHQEFFSYNHQEDEVVKRYENMRRVDRVSYFDVEEFEVIAEHYLDHLDFNQAGDVVDQAVGQHPYATSLKLLKAKVWMKKGHFRKSMKLLEELDHLLPNDQEYWMLKGELHLKLDQIVSADEAYERAVFLEDDERDQTCIEIAYQFMGIDYLPLAAKYFKIGNQYNPENSEILYELGSVYMELGKIDKALHFLNLQLDLDPYLEETWFTLGILYWDKLSDAEKAMEAFDYVLVINDKHEMAHFFKGQIWFKEGDYLQAIDWYERFGVVSKQESHASLLIAECYEEMDNTDKAMECYHKALEDDVNRFDAWLGLGYCNIEKKEYAEGMRYFNLVLKERNKYEEAWSGLGDCFFALGHEEMAIHAYEKSLAINPIQSELWSVYADVYLAVNDYTKAIDVINKGLKHVPDATDLMFQLAICHFHECNYEDARIALRALKEAGYARMDRFYEFCPEAEHNNSFAQILNE